MITYSFLQHYWWFLLSLLGGILVFLLFVQGANTFIFSLGRDERERQLIVNSTGRKWEFTFTTLVTFGGAFFASFPLFYSTSFGGAYWVWMAILLSFVLQAVAYEFQSKEGNVFGRKVYRGFLVFNGLAGPFLIGVAVGTFFTGSAFVIDKEVVGDSLLPAISRWTNSWHGLEALANPVNLLPGFALVFLSRLLGGLYLLNNVADEALQPRFRRAALGNAVLFLIFFVGWLVCLSLLTGFAELPSTGEIVRSPYHFLQTLCARPEVLVVLLVGVACVLTGVAALLGKGNAQKAIWPTGIGTVLAVTAILLTAGWNHTCYYPSTADLQSSLSIANSSASEFTLQTMSLVSLLIPLVLAYIAYAWYAIDRRKLTHDELEKDEHHY